MKRHRLQFPRRTLSPFSRDYAYNKSARSANTQAALGVSITLLAVPVTLFLVLALAAVAGWVVDVNVGVNKTMTLPGV